MGLGVGAGFPTSPLSNSDNIGYSGIGKARLRGILPINITGMAMFNSLPNKVGGESDQQWMFGGEIEYSLTSLVAHPYLGLNASIKYQMMNLWGKEANEETAAQVSASVAIMFNSM